MLARVAPQAQMSSHTDKGLLFYCVEMDVTTWMRSHARPRKSRFVMPTYMVLRGDEIGAHAAAGNGSAQHWVHTAARSMDVTAIASTKKKEKKKKKKEK